MSRVVCALVLSACGTTSNVEDGGDAGAPSNRDATSDFDAGVFEDARPRIDAGWAPEPNVPPPRNPSEELTVMTWNIEQFPMTATTSRRVQEILRENEVDVVGVQEIDDSDAFDALVRSMPEYDGFDAWDGSFIRVGMMYRIDRVRVDDVQTIFRDDNYAFPRAPLTAHVTATSTGASFDFNFVVLHLKASTDSESRERRKTASSRLFRWIEEKRAQEAEQDYIVVGDLNDKITDTGDHQVFGIFLDRPQDYRFLTWTLVDRNQHTFIPFDGLIDHIFITTTANPAYVPGSIEVLELERTVPRYERDVSDHRPVIARFKLR